MAASAETSSAIFHPLASSNAPSAVDEITRQSEAISLGTPSMVQSERPSRQSVSPADVAEREAWVERYIRLSDQMNPRELWTSMAEVDSRLRFGNIPDIHQRENIIAFFETQLESVVEMRHHPGRVDVLPDRTYYCGDIDFTIGGDDGQEGEGAKVITIYVVEIFGIGPGESKMSYCELVLDPSPLIERIAQTEEALEGYD